MKFLAALILAGASINTAWSQAVLSERQITRDVVKAATAYADAISCEHSKIGERSIAALVPYKADSPWATKYAVVWSGDIGCDGGTGSINSAISIVKVGMGSSFHVDPLLSSPSIKHEIPVRRIERLVAHTADSLTIEGKAYGPGDGNCCPSVNVRVTLKVDAKGNWKMVERKVIPPSK